MVEAITISRPYANAVFEIAQEKNELKFWSKLLSVLSKCIADPKFKFIISNSQVSDKQVISLFTDIIGEELGTNAQNFLALLVKSNRLQLLTEIAASFEHLCREAENLMIVNITSAFTLTAKQKEVISIALKNRLGRDIILSNEVDKSLLGGAIIRAGDLVIDGSALGKLNRLADYLI